MDHRNTARHTVSALAASIALTVCAGAMASTPVPESAPDEPGPASMPDAEREPGWTYHKESALAVGFGYQFARYHAQRAADYEDGQDLTEAIARDAGSLQIQVSTFPDHFESARWRVFEDGRTGLTVAYSGLSQAGCEEAATHEYLVRPGLDMLSQSLTLRAYPRQQVMHTESRDCAEGDMQVTYWTAYPGDPAHTRFIPFFRQPPSGTDGETTR